MGIPGAPMASSQPKSDLESTSASLPVFEAIDVRKEYDDGQVKALRGVDFQIREGEYVAIIGQSGSGKSTLLQLLGALDHPTSGRLLYRGKSLAELPDLAGYRAREIGFIFQAFHLLPTFTALENVQIPMFETARSPAKRKQRAVELLRSVGLEHRLHHFPSKLSGGERQRVAIARSLANGSSVLLADEPTGNLDSENADHILELLNRLRQDRKITLVLVTHDMDIARQATRTIHFKDGHIVSDRDNLTQ
jgi:ABC-type lipoprotein export system ATPase subunit